MVDRRRSAAMAAARPRSHETRVDGLTVGAIVPTIDKLERRCGKLLAIDIVQGRHRDEVERGLVTAEAEGADAARLAEAVVQEGGWTARRYPLVLGLSIRSYDDL